MTHRLVIPGVQKGDPSLTQQDPQKCRNDNTVRYTPHVHRRVWRCRQEERDEGHLQTVLGRGYKTTVRDS